MIKKLSFIVFAILLMSGIAFAATPGYRQNPGTGDILGQGKFQSDAHKIFRMVRYIPPVYQGAATLAANSIVIWDLTSDDGVTVTTTTVSGDSAVAGIIVTQALTPDVNGNTALQDIGKSNWTWLQTYGLSTVNIDTANNVLVGSAFGTSATAGEATRFSASATGQSVQQGRAGFLYDAATAGDDSVKVFITGLD